jgi:hypothetical protein
MPLTNNGTIEYTMPENIRQLIDKDFCVQLREELYKIFNLSLNDFVNETVLYYGGTAGWNTAFALACINTNKDELYNYYKTLPYYDSDFFDGDLQDLMVNYKVILKGSIEELLVNELGLNYEDFSSCIMCGKNYLKKDMTEDKEFSDYLICNKCKEDKENKDNPEYTPNANNYYKEGLKIVKDRFSR